MIFIFVILVLFIIFITIKIKIQIKNLKFKSKENKHLNEGYEFIIKIYILHKIPILKTTITNKKIQQLLNKPQIKEKIKKEKKKIIDDKKNMDKKLVTDIKNIDIQIEQIKFKIELGTEDAALTAIIIPIMSTIISMFLKNKIHEFNNNKKFQIIPIYINQNLINIEFSGIFEIKMIHIINMICIKRKRRGDKNERTSNRRPYDYSYE